LYRKTEPIKIYKRVRNRPPFVVFRIRTKRVNILLCQHDFIILPSVASTKILVSSNPYLLSSLQEFITSIRLCRFCNRASPHEDPYFRDDSHIRWANIINIISGWADLPQKSAFIFQHMSIQWPISESWLPHSIN
jgi:hypothetical protein